MRPLRLTREILDYLMATEGDHLISMSIPTHVRGREVGQDPIRLKNELAAVDARLEELGFKPRERNTKLASASLLLDDVEFWEHQGEQLAIYVDDDGDTTAIAVSEELRGAPSHVEEHFYVGYVLPNVGMSRLPVLVLTQNFVGLYDVDAYGAVRRDADLPESFEDVNWFVDRESQRQQHPDRAGSQRNRHGHEPSAERDADLDRFLRAVDSSITAAQSGHPLIVLGDDSLVSRFESLHTGDIISPENSGTREPNEAHVHDAALPLLIRHRDSVERAAGGEAVEALGGGSATSSWGDAIEDARQGRIGRIVINRDAAASDERSESLPGEPDLNGYRLNELVLAASATGADVILTDHPLDGNPIIAVRRY